MDIKDIEKQAALFLKKSVQLAAQPVIKYAETYLNNMYSFGKGSAYKITVLANDDESYRMIFDFFSEEHPVTEPGRSRVIKEALQQELNNKFPDEKCQVLVVFPLRKVKKSSGGFLRYK